MLSAKRLLLCNRHASSRWLNNGIVKSRSGVVHHELRAYPMSGTDRLDGSASTLPKTRCLVATTGFVRGERICTVDSQYVLSGERAMSVLRSLSDRKATTSLPSLEAIVTAIQACPGSTTLLVTRDSLLITLALYALHTCPQTTVAGDAVLSPLWEWVACMPPRTVPLGTLAVRHFEGSRHFEGLQRRVRVGELSQPLLSDENPAAAASDLMVRAVEEGGLEAVREPQIEAVLSEAMRVDLYEGRRSALTVRQHEEIAARTLRGSGSLTAQHLLSLERQLDESVLRPLTQLLTPQRSVCADADEWRSSEEAEGLRWAHFMMRSRAVNIRGGHGTTSGAPLTMELAVVPFLDMLNHTYKTPNVSFHFDPTEHHIVVTAQRRIRAGEELTVHYGNVSQRQCLFGDAPVSAECGLPRRQAVQSAVRRLERQQRYELVDEDDAESAAQVATASSQLPSTSSSSSVHNARAQAEREAAREAAWLWRFGFFRSKEEKAYEASNRWSRSLRRRIADLTDVRRKGRPGEFVIGVPEGLEHLREQRERLERERYNRTKVFPPQRS